MLDKNGKQLQRSSITKVDAFSKYYKTLLKLPRNVVATSSAQVREAGAELGAAARPGDGLPRGAGGPAPSVLPLLRPVARSELVCVLCLLCHVSCLLCLVSCLLSLLSCVRTLVACVRHIWSAIFLLRLHCPVTPPHKNKWKKLFDIYLIFTELHGITFLQYKT